MTVTISTNPSPLGQTADKRDCTRNHSVEAKLIH